MREEWREIEEFPDYSISSLGEVCNMRRGGGPVKTTRNQQGLSKVGLLVNGRQFNRSVTRIVADAFLPGKTDVFDTPIQLDGDRMNNNVENLMWRPRWFAIKFHKQFQMLAFHNAHPSIYVVGTGVEFYTLKDPCMEYGIVYTDIVISYMNHVYVFPTGQLFEQIDY